MSNEIAASRDCKGTQHLLQGIQSREGKVQGDLINLHDGDRLFSVVSSKMTETVGRN